MDTEKYDITKEGEIFRGNLIILGVALGLYLLANLVARRIAMEKINSEKDPIKKAKYKKHLKKLESDYKKCCRAVDKQMKKLQNHDQNNLSKKRGRAHPKRQPKHADKKKR